MFAKILPQIIYLLIVGLFILLVLLLSESKSAGSDPSTKGVGGSLILLPIAAIVFLLVFNLQSNNWIKYLGLVLGLLCVAALIVILLALSGSSWIFQQNRSHVTEVEKPKFDDPKLNEIFASFQNGDLENWKKQLQANPAYIHNKKLMNHLLLETNYNGTSEAPRLACLKYLFDSGAKLDSVFFDNFIQIAQSGNADMVDLLLQHGADANCKAESLGQRPVIFETIEGYGKIDEVLKVLIKYGADPNTKIKFDYQDQHTLTPLLYAVYREEWACCNVLLKNGADSNFKTKEGFCIKDLVLQKATEKKGQDQSENPVFWQLVKQFKAQAN